MKAFYFYMAFLVFATRKWAQSATSKETHEWIDGHNYLRLKVAKGEVNDQPSASKMDAIIWDNELSARAQAYANTYPKNHNPDKTIPSGRFEVGESLYWTWSSNPNYKFTPNKAIESWFSEHVNYTYEPFRSKDKSEPATGHYTQLVWSDSNYLGCGRSERYEGQDKVTYVVCYYGPAGNVKGFTPYEKGGPVQHLTCGCGRECNNCNNIYGGR